MERRVYSLTGFSKDLDGRKFLLQDDAGALPVCALCGQVSSQWYVINCSHRFCQSCFTGVVQKTPSTLRCPVDLKTFRPKRRLEPAEEATVLERRVSCWNQIHGCDFVGEVTEMVHHFGTCQCYQVTCQLCDSSVLWPELPQHVKSVHGKKTRSYGVLDPPLPHTGAVAVVPAQAPSLDGLLALLGDLVSRCPEEIKASQESHFLELARSVDTLKACVSAGPAGLHNGSSEDVGAKGCCDRSIHEDLPVSRFEWVVPRFSEIRVGIRYFRSDKFEIAPGFEVQLKGYIDGITRVELKVAVTIWKTADATQDCGDYRKWQYTREAVFHIVNIKRPEDSGTVRYGLDEVFGTSSPLLATPSGVTSDWLDITAIERAEFQRDFVSEDAFTLMFSIERADT